MNWIILMMSISLAYFPTFTYLYLPTYALIDRDWVSIYEESERLLYEEIDYLNEATNAERFAKDFKDISWVRIPGVYRDLSTPRVLVMEYVESLKLTDIDQVESLGLDKELLAKRTADSFLRQIVTTSFFHCEYCVFDVVYLFICYKD